MRKQRRKELLATTKKAQIVNRLLEQFEHLVEMRSLIIQPKHKITFSPSVPVTKRYLIAARRATAPIRSLMHVPRRIAKLRRLRS